MQIAKLVLGLSLLLIPCLGLSAVPDGDAKLRQVLHAIAPTLLIDRIDAAPLPGFRAVFAGGKLLYVSEDGHYLLDGRLVDLSARRDLSKATWASFRASQLAAVPAADYLIYAPPKPKYTVTVFTDIACGYCHALHQHMAEYNRLGIAIRYLPWPREGLLTTADRPTRTATEMKAIWCAADRHRAFDLAMHGSAPAAALATCSDALLQRAYAQGLSFGMAGTPGVIAPDGQVLGGYLAPEAMLEALQALSKPKT